MVERGGVMEGECDGGGIDGMDGWRGDGVGRYR